MYDLSTSGTFYSRSCKTAIRRTKVIVFLGYSQGATKLVLRDTSYSMCSGMTRNGEIKRLGYAFPIGTADLNKCIGLSEKSHLRGFYLSLIQR